MKRREFITLLGGAAAAWPLTVRAQQQRAPLLGFLSSRSVEDTKKLVGAFRDGLRASGFAEGENIKIEYRWANGQYQKLAVLAADLIDRRPSVLVTTGSEPSALAAKAATTTIPIVFVIGGDPVEFGLVQSLNRPEANVTGISASSSVLVPKRLELLHEMLPQEHVFALLVNPNSPGALIDIKEGRKAALALGIELIILNAATESDLEPAFLAARQKKVTGLSIGLDPFFGTIRTKLIALAAAYAIPTIWYFGYIVKEGGLISYAPDLADAYRQAGIYAAKILRGAKPSELPVQLPTKFELVINLKTAKALGLTVPPTLLTRADEVIE
jgi:putative tryptophan/tyrosine transport system substrate-binding protein